MKVTVELSPDCREPYAVIHAAQITDEIQQLVEMFRSRDAPITAISGEKTVILSPGDIYMVRVENKETLIYGSKDRYCSRKRLYELKEQLGSSFMQISKRAFVNLAYLESVEAGFGGTLLLKLKNGCKEYVSRTYLPQFKKYLGL